MSGSTTKSEQPKPCTWCDGETRDTCPECWGTGMVPPPPMTTTPQSEQELQLIDFMVAFKHAETTEEQSEVMAAAKAYVEQQTIRARKDQLDNLIDINSAQFRHWTQKDIANFFDTVGKQYRDLEQLLNTSGETLEKEPKGMENT